MVWEQGIHCLGARNCLLGTRNSDLGTTNLCCRGGELIVLDQGIVNWE